MEAFCITFHSVGARILRAVLMKWNTFHLLTFYSDLISCQHRTSNLGTIVKLVILVLLCVLYAKRVLLPSLLQQLPSALSSFCFHSIWFSSHEVIRRTLIASWLRLRGKWFFFFRSAIYVIPYCDNLLLDQESKIQSKTLWIFLAWYPHFARFLAGSITTRGNYGTVR